MGFSQKEHPVGTEPKTQCCCCCSRSLQFGVSPTHGSQRKSQKLGRGEGYWGHPGAVPIPQEGELQARKSCGENRQNSGKYPEESLGFCSSQAGAFQGNSIRSWSGSRGDTAPRPGFVLLKRRNVEKSQKSAFLPFFFLFFRLGFFSFPSRVLLSFKEQTRAKRFRELTGKNLERKTEIDLSVQKVFLRG